MAATNKPTTPEQKDTWVEIQHRIDLAISERMAHDEHRHDELRLALSGLEGRVQALSDMLRDQSHEFEKKLAAAVESAVLASLATHTTIQSELSTVLADETPRQLVKFIVDYRGKLSAEQFHETGTIISFPVPIAEQLIRDGRAIAYNRKARNNDNDED